MHRLRVGLAMAALAAALPLSSVAQDAMPASNASYLGVVSGTSGSVDDAALRIDGVEGILVFTDRPERQALTIPLDLADALEAGFIGDPPNAVLSVLEAEGPENTVVELTDVLDVGDSSITFAYSALGGELRSGDFGPASLFIDEAAPAIVEALCSSAETDPANEPAAVVAFCT